MARRLAATLMTVLTLALAAAAQAEDDSARARDDRIADLERKLELMTGEMAKLRTQVGVPEEPELKSRYGLGPAASKIYGQDRGLSLGGYGEVAYTAFVHDKQGQSNRFDARRSVLYVGYKFSDRIVFNSEIEFEHASTEANGAVSVEFANLDFFWRRALNFRVGLLLAPLGFINEIHEPPFFFGVNRPVTERVIIPATWSENGVGIFGKLGESVDYRLYAMASLRADRFSTKGIREGRQGGGQSLAEDFSLVGRVDWRPERIEGLLLGAGFSVGNTGQNLRDPNTKLKLPDARMTLGELHAQYRNGPFHARALFAYTFLNDTADLNAALGNGPDNAIARQMLGGYVETAYDLWPTLFGNDSKALEPFIRVEYVDPQFELAQGFHTDGSKASWIFTPGINFYPHPNVVLKAEYRNFQQRSGQRADEISLGMGFAF